MLNKKALAASVSASPAEYVEDVFSTYLYTGNGTSQTITNNIDLAGDGGLVWIKRRDSAVNHYLADTVGGTSNYLNSNTTSDYETGVTTRITSFNADGFSIGSAGSVNNNGSTFCSWTFREQAKFFDVVTYTGTGSATTIAHNLGSEPGMIIVKATSTTTDWVVYHRSAAASGYTAAQSYLRLNLTNAVTDNAVWNNTAPTSTVFSVGSGSPSNSNGITYVAYLFAHDAGGFGTAGTDDVVMCGSYTGNGSTTGPTVDLGFEPQFVLIKGDITAGNWLIFDNMRGIATGGDDPYLLPNSSAAEATGLSNAIDLNATGFQIRATSGQVNDNGTTYIYMAIRRPMKTPTSGTSVFAPVAAAAGSSTTITTNFPVDMVLLTDRSTSWVYNTTAEDRLRGGTIASITSSTDAERTDNASKFDSNISFVDGWSNLSTRNIVYHAFRRATGFFDVVCYTGTGSATTVAHNLGVVPELMIVKRRSTSGTSWFTYSTATGNTNALLLDTTDAAFSATAWNNTTPTSSVFSLGTSVGVNGSGSTYVAYLFATLAGVSKVGSYTGNGSNQTINCGFTAGARFVMIKRTDSTGDWYVWDTARGIVSGNDPYLLLNSTAAEVTNTDYIDPVNSGFEISSTAPAAINANGGSFIFMAIA